MGKGTINIIEINCLGCGYCEKFCLQGGGLLVMEGKKFSTLGFPLPSFINVEECNACGNCREMCPHFAIEVFKYLDSPEPDGADCPDPDSDAAARGPDSPNASAAAR